MVMLESKVRACRMTLRLERAVQRTNRTQFAIAVQQRVANRASSFVCRFHNPLAGLPSDSFVSLPSPSLHWTLLAGNLGLQFDRNACLRVFSPLARVQPKVYRTADLAGVVPTADRVLAHRK